MHELWDEIRQRGAASLRPNLARRVLSRMEAAREQFNARSAMLVGLSTALACLALTLAINLWSVRRASDQALAQWSALTFEDASLDSEI